jgi:hypothetical protein
MRRSNVTGICLIAALALSVAVSTSASAEPEFLTKAVVGEAVSTVPFNGTIGSTYWETNKSRVRLSCLSGTFAGEVTGPKAVDGTVMMLSGCESGSLNCSNTGGEESGKVQTKVLAGLLGGLTSTLPGIKLFSQAERHGGTFLEANCGGGLLKLAMTGEVTGSLAGAAGEGPETGKLLSAFKLSFVDRKYGIQKYKGFSEGPEAGLLGQLDYVSNGGPLEMAGLSSILTATTVPSTWGLGVTK